MNNAGLHLIADAVQTAHRLACPMCSGAVTVVHGGEPCPHADAFKNSGAAIIHCADEELEIVRQVDRGLSELGRMATDLAAYAESMKNGAPINNPLPDRPAEYWAAVDRAIGIAPESEANGKTQEVLSFGNQVAPPGLTERFIESADELPDEAEREYGYGD